MENSQNIKNTPLGIIPADWNALEIQSFAATSSGGTPSRAIKDYYVGNNRWFTTSELNDGYLFDSIEHISEEALNNSSAKVFPEGTLLIAMYGATIGKLGILTEPASTNQACCAIICSKTVDTRYLFYQLLFNRSSIVALGRGAGQPNISQDIVKQLTIAVPSLIEQQKIADALSGVDDMIGALDEAIAKKRQIKEGLMQQLLTGKTRLPGFTDDWVELRFDDFISRFATGLNPRSNFVLNVNASNYYITIKDFADGVLYFDQCDKVSDEAIKRINERSDLRKGDVLFSSIGRVGDAYVIEETPNNWNINESVFSLRPNTEIIDSHFLYYLIKSKDAQAKFQESITGTTLRSIKMGHLKEIVCCFPSSISEQREIAKTLKSMDMEILSSESLRDKYRLIKQGMMQELLTGKTRL